MIVNTINAEKLYKGSEELTFIGKSYRHYIKMANIVANVNDSPVVMEFGVDKGVSTSMFASILEKKNGHLISVDVRDCSKIISGWENWHFIQCDDRDFKVIDEIYKGYYDLIYVDSFCYNIDAFEHMNKIFDLWLSRIKKNGYMVIRGTDPKVYEKGGRKEDRKKFKMYTKVKNSVLDFYYGREQDYDLETCMGSCGMAFLKKLI